MRWPGNVMHFKNTIVIDVVFHISCLHLTILAFDTLKNVPQLHVPTACGSTSN